MKKVFLVVLCALLVVGVGACRKKQELPPADSSSISSSQSSAVELTTATPTGTVALLMESVRAFQPEEMRKYVTDPKQNGSLIGFGTDDRADDVGLQFVRNYTKGMTYQIKGETIDAGTAMVDLTITGPDLSKVIADLVSETTKYAAGKALKNEPMDVEKFILDYVQEKVDFSKLNTMTTDTTVILVQQKDGSWLVDNDTEVNFDFANALAGNMLEKIEGFIK